MGIRVRLVLLLFIVILAACQGNAGTSPPPDPVAENKQVAEPAKAGAVDRAVMGQTIYVPIYSSIYDYNAKTQLPLAATLSLRNTAVKKSIIIKSVEYYDTTGKLIRSYVNQALAVRPLATLSYVVERSDQAGAGANFIVRWVATEKVPPPVVEAVMINSRTQQGISFISQGRVIEAFGQ